MKKNKKNLGFVNMVIPFLFLDLISFNSRTLESAQDNLFSTDNIIRIISLFIASLIIIIKVVSRLRNTNFIVPAKPVGYLFLYLIIGFLSLINGNWLSYSFVKLFEYTIFLLFILNIYNSKINKKYMFLYCYKRLIYFLELLVLTVLLGLIISPSKALYSGLDEYSAVRDAFFPFILSGWIIRITSTSVGYFCAILSYIYIQKWVEGYRNVTLLIKILITIPFLFLAQCRMAILAFIVATLVYLLLNIKKTSSKILISIGSLVIVLNFNILISLFQRGQSTELLFSLSGRTEWWAYAMNYFKDLPIMNKFIGMGFAGAEKLVAYNSNKAMYTLDSEFFSVLIGVGILGVIFVSLSLFSAYKIAFQCKEYIHKLKKEDRCYYFQLLGILIMLTIRMITATTLALVSYYLMIYIVVVGMFTYLEIQIKECG